jgi:uncharacterized DUF497 family protein
MAVYFDWDDWKLRENLREHGIHFDDASLVFEDSYRITEEDIVYEGEQRWRTIGIAFGVMVLLVIHVDEDLNEDLLIRIISARKATPGESYDYDQSRT